MNRQCPACLINSHDKNSDHLFLMSDGETWCCNKVEYHDNGQNYYEKSDGSIWFSEEEEEEEEDVLSMVTVNEDLGYVAGLPQDQYLRKVHPDTLVKYGVHFEVNGVGKPDKHFYPTHSSGGELLGYEVRVTQPAKGFYKTFKVSEDLHLGGALFKDTTKPEHLIVCEGYLDAMSTYQILKDKGVRSFHVVSLQNGNSLKSLRDNLPYLKNCYNLYLYPDQDDPGMEVVRKLSKLLPNTKIMYTSEKDACDMYEAGKDAELYSAFKTAQRYKPASVILPSEAKAEAFKPVLWGLDYPFPYLTNMTYGLRLKRIIGIAAGPGAGKTQFIKAIQHHLLFTHKEKIGVFSLEESPGEAMRELAGYVMKLPLDRPDTEYDEDELSDVLDSFDDLVTIYDVDNYEKWEDIEEAIRYMASCGTKWFFIDPLSVLTVHLSASEANQFLNEAMFRMSKLVKKLDITIFHTNHLNNAASGKDHGEGAAVKASQMTGSRAQWKYSTDIWGLERDQYADDETERNTTRLVNLKYRKPSRPGAFGLLYSDTKGILEEVKAVF